MSNMIRNVVDRMMENPSSVAHAAFLAGGAAAALSLGSALPGAMPYLSDGLYCLFTWMPETNPANTANWFLTGAADYTASTGVGLEAEAKLRGVELAHQTREMLAEMRTWLGDRVDEAQNLYHSTISKSKAFASYAISTGKNFFDSPAGGAIKWIGGAILGLAGAWDSIKLIGKIFNKVFKKAGVEADPSDTDGAPRRDQPANVTNIQINLSLSGDQAERMLDGKMDQRLIEGIQAAVAQATTPPKDPIDSLGFDRRGIDTSRFFMPRSTEGLGPIASASQAFSDQLRSYAVEEFKARKLDPNLVITSGMFPPAPPNIDDIILRQADERDLRKITFKHRPYIEAAPRRDADDDTPGLNA